MTPKATSSAVPPRPDPQTSDLLDCLYDAATKSDSNPKPLVRHTLHTVPDASEPAKQHRITSWKTAEFAYRKAASVGIGKDLPTLARGLFTTAESPSSSDDADAESSTAAQKREQQRRQRICVRGYDKFFNVGEMSWTKPAAIERYSSPPYLLTFKENGCIIFISALSETQLVVTSKHALQPTVQQAAKRDAGFEGEGDDVDADDVLGEAGSGSQRNKVSHAAKGEEWLDKHLACVGKRKVDLARALWVRGQTAVAELCDDSFEEHVLAYPPERSGLHLHGLNNNTVAFQTCPMTEVDAFAKEWGMIPTRWLSMQSMDEVKAFTDRIGTTGEYEGEAIEGFVVRTTMPDAGANGQDSQIAGTAPPYDPGQTWFYKVKFDEPYLMYRDWRELAKRMLIDRKKWEQEGGRQGQMASGQAASQRPQSQAPSQTDAVVNGDDTNKSKNQVKRERKAVAQQEQRRQAATKFTVPPPDLPKPRSNRPETKLFVQWCYERMYERGQVALFEGIQHGKGIIRVRDAYLAWLETDEGRSRLAKLGGAQGALSVKLGSIDQPAQASADPTVDTEGDRPFTHVVLVPIAVPGCGKTSLFIALRHLFPHLMAHTQSDDVKSKKTAPTFLRNICTELSSSKCKVLLADRNNHLLKHRDEIVEAVREWEAAGGCAPNTNKKKGQKADTPPSSDKSPRPKVKLIALTWSLDLLPLNTLHHLLSDRIFARGANHQSLLADTTSASGSRTHETILWRFLSALETLGSAEGKGEGDKGSGDAALDTVISLDVQTSLEDQLRVALRHLSLLVPDSVASIRVPEDAKIIEALRVASDHKVTVRKVEPGMAPDAQDKDAAASTEPRYYGISVQADLLQLVEQVMAAGGVESGAREFFAALKKSRRVNPRPHITLVHSSALKQDDEAVQSDPTKAAERRGALQRWNRYAELARGGVSGASASASGAVEFDIDLDELVWDADVMALSLRAVTPVTSTTTTTTTTTTLTEDEFHTLQGPQWCPHITIGTRDDSIRPFEANRIVRIARDRAQRRVAQSQSQEQTQSEEDGVVALSEKVRSLSLKQSGAGGGQGQVVRLRGRLMGLR